MSISPELLQSAIKKGKVGWLKDYLSDNLHYLNLASTNYQHWFDDFIHTMESKGLSKPHQQKNPLTNVRNAIKVFDPDHPALEVIKFSKATWVEINETDRDRIAERSTKLLDNPDAIVNTAIELIKTNNWSDIAAGLAVLTGRRCGEILQTARFEYKTEYSVIFEGSLKRREEPFEPIFEIPLLCRSDLIIQALDCLRLQLGDEVQSLTPTQINQCYEESVAKKCDRHFSTLVPKRDGKNNLYTHLFKAVYATISCHWYCPPTVPEMEYRAAIQGHYQILNEKNNKLRRSLAAGRHYFDYKIADGSGNIDGRLGIKLGLPGIKVIEPFRENHKELASAITDKNNPIKITKAKSLPRQKLTMNTNKQTNPLSEAVVSLQLSLSRLDSISDLLNLSQTDTINTLVDWAETGAFLARHLMNFDHPTPEALREHVVELELNYTSLCNVSEPIADPNARSNVSSNEHQRLINSVSSLSKSVETLTNLNRDLTKALLETERSSTEKSKPLSPVNPQSSDSTIETKQRSKNRKVLPEDRERDSSEDLESDINNAIDAIMKFNDSPDRPHRQKFMLSVRVISNLTGRALNSVSKILKTRQEEIDEHYQKHKISKNHNRSRKDKNGPYPPIEEEPEITYHKITSLAK